MGTPEKYKPTTWHRHALEFLRLEEVAVDEPGNIPRRYRYCPICNRIPDTLVGPNA